MSELELVIGNKAYSSWSLRPWLVLKHAGMPFRETLIPLYVPGYKERLLQFSASGKVPILRQGQLTIWESLAICEYLAEAFPDARLWPPDKSARAEARAVSAEMHAGFSGIRRAMPFNCRARGRHVPSTPELESEIARVVTLWEGCRTRYGAGGAWLFGRFSIADAMFAPVALRFLTYGVPLPGAARDYVDTVSSHPAVLAWIEAAKQETEVIDDNEVGK